MMLKSLVKIRINEIFPRLACYGQKLTFLFGNEIKINTSSVKRNGEDQIGTFFFLKSVIYDAF